MKALQALLAAFALSGLTALGELVTDPVTGLRTGTITVNGETYTIGPNVDLSNANLSGAGLWEANLRGANLRDANLSDADIVMADLSGADLSGADLSRARCEGTSFLQADLREADLIGANLQSNQHPGGIETTNFSLADLRGANLTRALLDGATFEGANLEGSISSSFAGQKIAEIESRLETPGGGSGITLEQAAAIEANSTKVGITPVQAEAVEANTAKTGITIEQAARIEANRIELSAVKILLDVMNVQLQQLNTRVGDLQVSIDEKDEQIAELSQRPTVEELQDARTGSLVFSADQGTNLVTLEFEIQESEDLRDWVSRTEKVTTTVPLGEGKRFVRIALRK